MATMDSLAEQDMLSAKFLKRVRVYGLEPKASSDEAIGRTVAKNGPDGWRLGLVGFTSP